MDASISAAGRWTARSECGCEPSTPTWSTVRRFCAAQSLLLHTATGFRAPCATITMRSDATPSASRRSRTVAARCKESASSSAPAPVSSAWPATATTRCGRCWSQLAWAAISARARLPSAALPGLKNTRSPMPWRSSSCRCRSTEMVGSDDGDRESDTDRRGGNGFVVAGWDGGGRRPSRPLRGLPHDQVAPRLGGRCGLRIADHERLEDSLSNVVAALRQILLRGRQQTDRDQFGAVPAPGIARRLQGMRRLGQGGRRHERQNQRDNHTHAHHSRHGRGENIQLGVAKRGQAEWGHWGGARMTIKVGSHVARELRRNDDGVAGAAPCAPDGVWPRKSGGWRTRTSARDRDPAWPIVRAAQVRHLAGYPAMAEGHHAMAESRVGIGR